MSSELIDEDAIQYQKYADILRIYKIAEECRRSSPVIVAMEGRV